MNWIKVKDDLPPMYLGKTSICVLAYCSVVKDWLAGQYDYTQRKWLSWEAGDEIHAVTHWMKVDVLPTD